MTMFNTCLHLNLSQIYSHFTNDCQLCLASVKDLMVGRSQKNQLLTNTQKNQKKKEEPCLIFDLWCQIECNLVCLETQQKKEKY